MNKESDIPTKRVYGHYKCKCCGKQKRAWIESLCYIQSICPDCIDTYEDFADNEMGIDPLARRG